ncbi:MAG: hypothetical protein Q4D41_11605 [Prevotellaceae bacterium]|nr:hypothetical protein [Prevotellaceae bacterium]
MKKLSFIAMMLIGVLASGTFVSCGSDDDGSSGSGGDNQGGSSTDTLTTMEQKQLLETTANELMALVNVSDFQAVAEIGDYINDTETDNSAIDSFFDAGYEACTVSSSDELIRNLYKASNFYGVFELQSGRWRLTSTSVSYLEFNFTDGSGKSCSLRVTCSGNETTVHNDVFDDSEEDYIYRDGYGTWIETRIENSIVIPEQINVTLKQSGTTLASVSVKSSLTLANGPEFDYTTDNAEISMTTTVSQYSVAIETFAFNAGKDASMSAKLQKSGETLVSLDVNGTGDLSDEDNLTGSVTSNFNIMNKVRLSGSLTSIEKFNKYLERASDNDYNETEFKSSLSNANALMDIKAYFNKSSVANAYMQLYPFSSTGYYGERWDYEPVIVFADGSSYSTFESYFDEIFFDSVINKFKKLGDDFVDLVK